MVCGRDARAGSGLYDGGRPRGATAADGRGGPGMNRINVPASELSYHRILEVLTDGALVVGPGGFEYVNAAFTRMSGYCLEDLVGQDPLLLTSDDCDREFYEHAWRTARQGHLWQGPMVCRWKDGTACAQDVAITPVFSASGAPTHLVMVTRDGAPHRALEQRLARAQKLGVVGTLAGNIGHDLNNLLTVIGCNIETCLESVDENQPHYRALLNAQNAADQVAELIRNLLDFSRDTQSRWVNRDLSQVLTEALRLMRNTAPPAVELRTAVSSDPLPVCCDPARICHAIVNLCVNAWEAMPEGGTLTVSAFERSVDDVRAATDPHARTGRFVVLSVEDTGHGTQPRMLDELFGVSGAETPVLSGGLGLNVVRQVVVVHQGWIGVESVLERGTRVDIHLPFRTTPCEQPGRANDPEALRGTGTVLLVNGQPMIVALLRTVLESQAYQVLSAATATEALALLAQHPRIVAGIVLDWDMHAAVEPGVVSRLRHTTPALPVILIGDRIPSPTEASSVPGQNTRYVAKPFTPTEVLWTLKSVLDAEDPARPPPL